MSVSPCFRAHPHINHLNCFYIEVILCILLLDLIDIVKEQLYGHDYEENEDPKLYISQKTKRGPLAESWLEDYWNEVHILLTYFKILNYSID